MKRRRLAPHHIAESLDAPPSTVWLPMRDSPGTPYATHARAKAAPEAPGYVHHRNATALRTSKTLSVGVIFNDIRAPFVRELVASIEEALAKTGRTVILCDSGGSVSRQTGFIRKMAEFNADGVVVCPAIGSTPEDFSVLGRAIPPVVFVSRALFDLPFDCVVPDEREAASLAVRHLTRLGHRRIALLGPDRSIGGFEEWLRGYRRELRIASIECERMLVTSSLATRMAGYSAARWFAGLTPKPSAAICSSVAVALGLSGGLRREGLLPGRDIALVGHEDIEEAYLVNPRLTVAGPSAHDMGSKAVSALLKRIEHPGIPPRRVVLAPSLVVRESCGSAAGTDS